MKKWFKTYSPFARATVQEFLAYPFEFIMYIIGSSVGMFVVYYIWKVIYTNGNTVVLEGFTFNDMIGYIILSFTTALCLDSGTVWIIASEVRQGSIIMNLIKPINYHMRIFFETSGFSTLFILILVIPTTLVLSLVFEIGTIVMLPFFILSIGLALVITFLFDALFGMMAFYIQNLWGIGFGKAALVRLLSGALIPLPFFPEAVQKVFNFLPFKGMVYTPVAIFLGKITGTSLAYAFANQMVWILILGVMNYLVWRKAVNYLTVQGG